MMSKKGKTCTAAYCQKIQRFISLILALIFVVGIIPVYKINASANHPFEDVPDGTFYTDAAAYMYKLGYIRGTNNTSFSPKENCTRAMVVTILWRIAGEPEPTGTTQFTDLTANWYIDAVRWANENGIVKGIDFQTFQPNGLVTREQFATILHRYCIEYKKYDLTDTAELTLFEDATDTSSYAKEAISWAVGSEIIKGSQEGERILLRPKGYANRAQIATIFTRFLKDVEPLFLGIPMFEITFEMNGASGIPSQKVKQGEYIDKPDPPVRDGFLFCGWFVDSELENPYFFDRPANRDITLYAKWIDYPSERTYTRGEWVSFLLDIANIELIPKDQLNAPYFFDSSDSYYFEAIETAMVYGVLPPDITESYGVSPPYFKPDEIATREFAAYSAVRSMGFQYGNYQSLIPCKDYNQIRYVDEVSTALAWGFLPLENGCFYPQDPVNAEDAALVASAIQAVRASETISDDEYLEYVQYDEQVIMLENTTYSLNQISDEIFQLELSTQNDSPINEGSVILLPANDLYRSPISLRVEKIKNENRSSKVIAECSVPQLSEVYQHVTYIGDAIFLPEGVTSSPGIDMKYIPEDQRQNRMGGTSEITDSMGELIFTLHEEHFATYLNADATISIKVPSVTANIDFSVDDDGETSFYDFMLVVELVEKFEGSFQVDIPNKYGYYNIDDGKTQYENKDIELGRIPFMLGTSGLSVDIVFFANVSVSGTFTVSYEIMQSKGFQYTNGTLRKIGAIKDSFPNAELNGSAKAGVGVAIDVCACYLLDLAGYYANVGAAFELSYTPHVLPNLPTYCAEGSFYIYFRHGLDQETVLGMFLENIYDFDLEYKLEFEPIGKDESNPTLRSIHIENMKIVPQCTCSTGSVSATLVDDSNLKPLNEVRIDLYYGDTIIATDFPKEGAYYKNSIPVGRYTLVVSADGYSSKKLVFNVDQDQCYDFGPIYVKPISTMDTNLTDLLSTLPYTGDINSLNINGHQMKNMADTILNSISKAQADYPFLADPFGYCRVALFDTGNGVPALWVTHGYSENPPEQIGGSEEGCFVTSSQVYVLSGDEFEMVLDENADNCYLCDEGFIINKIVPPGVGVATVYEIAPETLGTKVSHFYEVFEIQSRNKPSASVIKEHVMNRSPYSEQYDYSSYNTDLCFNAGYYCWRVAAKDGKFVNQSECEKYMHVFSDADWLLGHGQMGHTDLVHFWSGAWDDGEIVAVSLQNISDLLK